MTAPPPPTPASTPAPTPAPIPVSRPIVRVTTSGGPIFFAKPRHVLLEVLEFVVHIIVGTGLLALIALVAVYLDDWEASLAISHPHTPPWMLTAIHGAAACIFVGDLITFGFFFVYQTLGLIWRLGRAFRWNLR